MVCMLEKGYGAAASELAEATGGGDQGVTVGS